MEEDGVGLIAQAFEKWPPLFLYVAITRTQEGIVTERTDSTGL